MCCFSNCVVFDAIVCDLQATTCESVCKRRKILALLAILLYCRGEAALEILTSSHKLLLFDCVSVWLCLCVCVSACMILLL